MPNHFHNARKFSSSTKTVLSFITSGSLLKEAAKRRENDVTA